MDVSLGHIAANVTLLQPQTHPDYSSVISAGAVLLGVIVSQVFEWLKRRDDEREEKRKRFFNLKKGAYFGLIEDAIEWDNYHVANPETDVEGTPDSPSLVKLRKSYRLAQLVADTKTVPVIRKAWNTLTWEFIENELIPALREDLEGQEDTKAKHWYQFWKWFRK